MEIGHRIKQARTAAGLSQTDLARATGVSRGLVGQWESHRKKPGRDVLAKIARATSVTVEFLLGDERLDEAVLVVSDPDEAALLRRYRMLSERQRRSVHELIGIASSFPGAEQAAIDPSAEVVALSG